MEVVGRHFVRHLDEALDSEWIAWFIIVQSVDLRSRHDRRRNSKCGILLVRGACRGQGIEI
ncbi:hypothetical protein CPY51_10270 [Rhizobium tubonense]|uniref:Uncharacterized protein n=1 Tax=Rhizobium tubonense TaxID=484088 RepID=A0A2W4ELG5_9HYPH|nr:hypothetical protein CPY51_10270 [Rhizobium tubonense]